MSADLGRALARGAFWSIVLRWGGRAIGLLSTLVIARLLTPADYGLVAMATLVMALVETFLDVDAATILLRSPSADADVVQSAWTLKLLQSLALAVVLAVAAPFASSYFDEPRLTPVLWAYCVVVLASGVASVGPVLARRELDFLLEVKVALASRVIAFAATVPLAVALRSYWALVAGALVGAVAGVVLGYALHPFRPRFRTSRILEQLGFSQWLLVSGVGVFFARRVDGFVVGRIGSTGDLGAYNVALELGQMVTVELGAPLNRALLPVLSTLHGDPPRMRDALMKTVAAVNLVTLPAGVGLAMVAPLLVPMVLGPQWAAAIPLLALFSIVGAIRFMTGPYYTLLVTLGQSRLLAFMSWIELAAFAAAVAWLWPEGVTGIAHARVVSALVIGAIWLEIGRRAGLPLGAFARAVARPLSGSVLMAGVLAVLPPLSAVPAVALLAEMLIGAAVYGAWIAGTWWAAGRPPGLESLVVDRIARALRRAR